MQIAPPPKPKEEEQATTEEVKYVPPFGTLEWIQHWSQEEGLLPTPIDVSITGSIVYWCPELKWYNFDVYPHKVKLTNTGYTIVFGAKWKTERPYLEGGPFAEKHILSQIHFHWGADMTEGSDHTVDKRRYPGEMQVTFFRSEYMTQQEAFRHPDGVVMICYMIKAQENVWYVQVGFRTNGTHKSTPFHKVHGEVTFNQVKKVFCAFVDLEKYGVNPDDRLSWVIEGFQRIQEAQTSTRIGPYPMSRLMPMFYEDYFLYWGGLKTAKGETYVVRWLVPRVTLFASFEQMKEFRKIWDPWDEPNLRNFRPLQNNEGRHVLFINPHWNRYNSLLPIPRVPEPSISVLSPAYQANLWMLPPQNAYMIPHEEDEQQE